MTKYTVKLKKYDFTVTFNPSLDYIVSVDDFKLGLTKPYKLRTHASRWKGINVSIVLKNLGIESTALGSWQDLQEEITKKTGRRRNIGSSD